MVQPHFTPDESMSLADRIRKDFPILNTQMGGHPLAYLDNGATTQKPQAVIDAISHYYSCDNANIHRGLYELSQRATDSYERARDKVAAFLGNVAREECIFVRGTTEAINLVAHSWGRVNLREGDEIIVSGLEHHSNIVPWQLACEVSGAKLRVWYSNEDGELDLDRLKELLNDRTKMVAVQHVSNALGTIHDVKAITRVAKQHGVCVLVDGAQSVAHAKTDVKEIGCDFYTLSGHKLFGPTGIGVLWGRRELLENLPPFHGGGDMIETVAFEQTTYAPLPNRFEAGTPDIAGAIGLGAAIDYVQSIGFEAIEAYETELLNYARQEMQTVPGLRIIGDASHKAAVMSFVLESPSIAPMDIANALSNAGIAIRTGHHCCMPLMGQLEVTGTSRASFAMYNTREEIDRLVASLKSLVEQRVKSREAKSSSNQSHSDHPATHQPSASVDANSAVADKTVSENSDTGIEFAAASASSVTQAADDLAEEFLDFDDPKSKTELLMELGQELPDHFEPLKKVSTAVPGCMSEVYLIGRPCPSDPERFEFCADSNAEIVRGLIAVLQTLFSGQPAEQILEFKIESFFRRIGLDQFVSTQRRSGLNGMINRIRTLAATILERKV